jgi:raffinose/stachyose/melibiose transport system permease protein
MALKKSISNIVLYIIAVAAFVVFCFPFFMLIVNSFKTNGEIIDNPFALPKQISWAHFYDVVEKMNFSVTFKNTFLITTISTALIILFSSMMAYYFVRNSTKFNNTIFFTMVASMIIPFQSIMIPLIYIYGAKLHIITSHPLILLVMLYIGFGASLAVFIFHGFIKSIPLELEEAARIDGCNTIQTFFRIVFPMLAPTAVTIAILNVLWIWNDYLLPSLVLYEETDLTMPIKMKVFNGQYMDNWELLIPAILITILPILFAYLIGQRFIIKGVMQGAIK